MEGEREVLNGSNALEMVVCLRLLQLQRKSLVNYKVQCKFVDHMQIYVVQYIKIDIQYIKIDTQYIKVLNG